MTYASTSVDERLRALAEDGHRVVVTGSADEGYAVTLNVGV